MTVPFGMPFGIFVTVERQTEDKWGNWVVSGTHTVGPCGIDYPIAKGIRTSSGSELTDDRETVTRIAILYCPPDSNITSTDRVVLPDGTFWNVIGMGADYTSPLTGWNPGVAVRMTAVTG